jgi:nitrous oxidase accessory protein
MSLSAATSGIGPRSGRWIRGVSGETAERALVENSRFEGNLCGVYVHGIRLAFQRQGIGRASQQRPATACGTRPTSPSPGYIPLRPRRHLLDIEPQDRFIDNRTAVRFAVHYIRNDSEVSGNVSVGNHVGYAIMYSNRLIIRGNISDRDRDYGMLFNYANYAEIDGNWVNGGPLDNIASSRDEGPAEERGMLPESKPEPGLRSGPGKCVFIYNTNHNKFRNNWFERCGIGVHFTAGSEGNEITGNVFVGNRNQVKYVGTRDLDWSKGGRGNYWSDNPAFDLDGDGIADTAYRPNDLVDGVVDRAVGEGLITARCVLRWAQAQFPALYPGGVVVPSPDRRRRNHQSAGACDDVTVAVTGVRRATARSRRRNVLVRPRSGRLSALVG